MLIIADENIPFVKDAFRTFGEVVTFSGREITREKIKDGDVLLVRSVTRVNRELLEGSKIKFIATAAVGIDNIDIDFLKEKRIDFSSAQGSNATSVAEYVMCAMLCLANRMAFQLSQKRLGVIGVGNVGSRVVKMAKGLGMEVLENDPPLARKTKDARFKEIEDVIKADIITFHVPLSYKGRDATFHMVNEKFLAQLKKDAILINTSRGGVVETKALYEAIKKKNLLASVIDVWENEPGIDNDLLKEVSLATPHIAGYSLDGKVNGTRMIYKACAEFFKLKPSWKQEESMPEPPIRELEIEANGRPMGHPVGRRSHPVDRDEEILWNTVRRIYDIEKDDQSLRNILNLKKEERGPYFDRLRKEYPVRREFFNTTLTITSSKSLTDKFLSLGFKRIPPN